MLQPNNCSSEAGSEEMGGPDGEKSSLLLPGLHLSMDIQFWHTEYTALWIWSKVHSKRWTQLDLQPTEDCGPHGERQHRVVWHTRNQIQLKWQRGGDKHQGQKDKCWNPRLPSYHYKNVPKTRANTLKKKKKTQTWGLLAWKHLWIIYWRMGYVTVKKNDSPSSSSH